MRLTFAVAAVCRQDFADAERHATVTFGDERHVSVTLAPG
jgi:hypothetical protein